MTHFPTRAPTLKSDPNLISKKFSVINEITKPHQKDATFTFVQKRLSNFLLSFIFVLIFISTFNYIKDEKASASYTVVFVNIMMKTEDSHFHIIFYFFVCNYEKQFFRPQLGKNWEGNSLIICCFSLIFVDFRWFFVDFCSFPSFFAILNFIIFLINQRVSCPWKELGKILYSKRLLKKGKFFIKSK